ncbi:MAG: extracellular solute-binding protein [Actinobacteria bacterium]|nr:extracellular solute-binding protein [Actinomycetota bacterium]
MMAAIAGIGAAALVISACGSSGTGNPGSSQSSSQSSSSQGGSSSEQSSQSSGGSTESTSSGSGGSGDAAAGDDNTWCDSIKQNWPDIKGKSVTIYSSITGDEATSLKESWKDFTDCTGATIKFNSDKNFEQQIVVQARSGNPPDLAFVPQPGLLQTLVSTGKTVPAPAQVEANVDKYWDPGWKTYATVNGKFYGAPLGANVKSLVWYSPKMFKAAGYQVPQTWDDMIKLSDTIAAAGDVKPWCAGIASGNATGWPATDWLEEVVLRSAGPQVYDDWVAGKVKFTDQPIADALAKVGSILKNPKYVNGGLGDVKSIATTDFDKAGAPILSGKCYMMQMASFYTWPAGTKVAEDGDVYAFYEPAMSDQFGKPVEVGGEFVVAFDTKPEVQAVQFYLSTAHWANNQSKASASRISANKGLKIENVQGAINKLSVSILQDKAAVSRFDASDLMPAAVGSGAEWTQLTSWITGQDDATTLKAIQDAWPAS